MRSLKIIGVFLLIRMLWSALSLVPLIPVEYDGSFDLDKDYETKLCGLNYMVTCFHSNFGDNYPLILKNSFM
ncbi:MAG: hypothetical protein COV91_01685 [Candidatus Taylorbacteria bacterium CG11_big_fil_rev_8_21_14_0_20_46_11]|uniref:Uncharacterized protein n=1 Tax=Candidatus Taylorbacteria bacterium CG11_big_fil_rev_8_21_14_0_20_46_11 TaxID=1975025 RepID=A0A2H0KE79_9BACT|nr:MAG: hypothetical protein COV91_01685 [Candidatus Taylorbacteria bacterium CG11_big_fil_rev_8_21_14_0_20_46_11]